MPIRWVNREHGLVGCDNPRCKYVWRKNKATGTRLPKQCPRCHKS